MNHQMSKFRVVMGNKQAAMQNCLIRQVGIWQIAAADNVCFLTSIHTELLTLLLQ